jgi:hypothetical protein
MTKSSGSKSPFYAEDLDGKVQKPATFYVTCNNTMIRGIDLRVRTHNQNMTVAAIQMAERNKSPHRS